MFKRCRHERVRCLHGDEIIHRGFRRRACVDCGRALKGPLPEVCTVTGSVHQSYREQMTGG